MNLLSFANSSFFFSLRKITQLNSQQPKLEDINRSPWFELYSRWKWSAYLVCTVWASGELLMRRDHLTPENNISSDSARNSVITCNYVKLRHVSHTPEHGNIARRAKGSFFLSSWYDVPLSFSYKIIQRIQVWQDFVHICGYYVIVRVPVYVFANSWRYVTCNYIVTGNR